MVHQVPHRDRVGPGRELGDVAPDRGVEVELARLGSRAMAIAVNCFEVEAM